MTVSLDFDETYLDPASAFGRYRRATLWNPALEGAPTETMRGFIAGIGKGEGPHGEMFRYRSPNSDLLGIIVERASGARYADLMSETLWSPLQARRDAFVTVDAEGTARAAGGISVAARDLARVGEMMRQGGAVDGRQVVPESWVSDTLNGGDAAAWKRGDFSFLLPDGRYRNKWYQTGYESRAFCGIGIHGQWLYVDPAAETVIVKLSSQPLPADDPMDKECLDFFQAIARMV
jgi:CubicO group peptidase (beta-lactamase class C family)